MAEEGSAPEPKKYQTYQLRVDPDQDDKAKEIKLCNFSRPHMRAFHCSWWGFFIAFFIWFAIAPLLSEIKDTLQITKKDLWTSSIVSVAGTICMRFILGPMCDKYGARILMTVVLCAASIPTALTGVIQTKQGLIVLRLFIGIAGGTFVMCQYWSSRMFTKEVVGTANALVGGWGNLGGGVTQLIMGSVLFPLFKLGMSAEMAWRTVCIVPAVVAFSTGVAIYFISDDAPKGNYNDLKKNGLMPEVSAAASFRSGAMNFNTWILFLQYGCSFGVELTMNNAAALYFKDAFGQTTESAAAIASIFGWMNLFARGLGGWSSDKANARMGMRGRMWVQTILLLLEGAMVLIFANTNQMAAAIVIMVFFSVFVQGAEGSTYGIVPYVNPPVTGSIAGIVGAGGNTGAVGFGLAFRQYAPDYKPPFMIMGFTIIASALLSALLRIKGHAGLVCGSDAPETKSAGTLAVPLPDGDDDDEEAAAENEEKEVAVEKEEEA